MAEAWLIGIAGTAAGLMVGVLIGWGILLRMRDTPRCPYCRRRWRAGRG